MLTCKLGNQIINCYDGTYSKEQLKKWATKKILVCPACGKPFEYCHGKIVSPYFRHMEKNQCVALYSEPETEEHLKGKKDIFEWIKKQKGVENAVLEGWIPETKQRPDIMFDYHGKKCVIEYQCSPIASEYLERHELYKTSGIYDIWICGTLKYLDFNKKLNTLEKDARLYYDVFDKCFYQTHHMSQDDFKKILKIQDLRGHLTTLYKQRKYYTRTFHIMKNIYDYHNGYINYKYIKHISNSYYCTGAYYPSPTRRPSRKYPYPVRKYSYFENYSFGVCYKLSNTKLSHIKGVEKNE